MRNEECKEEVVNAIVQIVHLASGRGSAQVIEPIELHAPALSGFLDAASMITKHYCRVTERREMLLAFSQDVLELVANAPKAERSQEIGLESSLYEDLCAALVTLEDDSITHKLIELLQRAKAELEIAVQGEYSFFQTINLALILSLRRGKSSAG
jgi:hypothetical protein